tara:strand:+ start:2429 stop:3196 length:768 start_codon:yes stop_codon:yes gene_type:complete
MVISLDPRTLEQLRKEGIDPSRLKERKTATSDKPYTTAGLPSLQIIDSPELANTNTRGFMLGSNRIADFDKNRAQSQAVFLRPDADKNTIAHEQEHLLARQGLGTGAMINEKFDALMGKSGSGARRQFVKDAVGAAGHLKDKYGIDNAYFDPSMLKQGGTALYEQLATLAGHETANNVDLTKDPVLRKTLFKDKDVRETYNAITGLRQTRLDAKDLPSYTRQPEPTEPGMVDKLKQLIGYANGGYVASAGRKKDI